MSILLLSIKISGSIDLVNDQRVQLTQSEIPISKIPFETELKMKGDLMEPSITFDIVYQTVIIVSLQGNQYHSSKTNCAAT
jgi:hypothetical protein